jgi:uncharacterized protein YjbI with pentapeptide repeats
MMRDFSGQNLRGRDFRGQDLREANFSGAAIRDARFIDADLQGANFTGAIVEKELGVKNAIKGLIAISTVNIKIFI